MTEAFFTSDDGDWFVPTSHSRGPWDADSCHAGPPTGLLARAAEALVPGARLTRLTVDLLRPIPMAGFRIRAELTRSGRTVSTAALSLVDGEGRERVRASSLHLAVRDEVAVPTIAQPLHRPEEAEPGPFPFTEAGHGQAAFMGGVELRYPPGQDPGPGPTRVWMRTLPLLADEEPSPFQRICPLADCGNAFSRNADPHRVGFVNPDLTVVLHRDPVGKWLGSDSVSYWEPTGIGLADALLFDAEGVVGRACQTLLLTPNDEVAGSTD